MLDANNGEIWAKLDAGTNDYFQLVDRPNVSLDQVLENILDAARRRPVVIQSLFMRVKGQPIPDAEVAAYCARLDDLLSKGGAIKNVQLYTIARTPAEPTVEPLGDEELDAIAEVVRARVPVEVETFYGIS